MTAYALATYWYNNRDLPNKTLRHLESEHTFKDHNNQQLLEEVRRQTRTNWQVAVFEKTFNDDHYDTGEQTEEVYMLYVANRKGQHVRVVSFLEDIDGKEPDPWHVPLDLVLSFLNGQRFNHMHQLEMRYTGQEWSRLKQNRLMLEAKLFKKPQFSSKFEIRASVKSYNPENWNPVKGGYQDRLLGLDQRENERCLHSYPEIRELVFLANKHTGCEWKIVEREVRSTYQGAERSMGRHQLGFYNELEEEEVVIRFDNTKLKMFGNTSTHPQNIAAFLSGVVDV